MQQHPARRIASMLATLTGCFLLIGLFALQMRYEGVESGALPFAPTDASAAHAPTASAARIASPASARTITAAYCSEVVAASDPSNPSGRTSTQMTFDDSWFFRDARTYQHDLATACSVLAAVCNSESQFYDGVPGSIPYAEQALGDLGFHDVRTESYALRSSVLDEMGSLLAGSSDVAAYTLAAKTLAMGSDGSPTTLVFVGIRGTYGAEWLSNFNVLGQSVTDVDHRGFKAAELEVEQAVRDYARELGADPSHTRILVTGHSRGGAIANLLAADLANPDGKPALAPSSGIFAYTFAAPGATRALDRHDEEYAHIFNVVNEADIVPQLPLSAWGFGRYGTTVTLPNAENADFDSSFATMQTAYHRNTGHAPGFDESELEALGSFGTSVSCRVPRAEDLFSPLGIFGTIQSLAGIDIGAALNAHVPDTYIAWMQSVHLGRTAAA